MFGTLDMEGHGDLHEVSRQAAHDVLQARKRQMQERITQPDWRARKQELELAQPAKLAKLVEMGEPGKHEQQFVNEQLEMPEPFKRDPFVNVKAETAEPFKQEQLVNAKLETAEPVKQEQVRRQWKAGDLRMNGPAGNLEIAEHAYVEGCCWSQSFCQNNCNTRRLINKRNYTLPQEVIILSK